jgi:hypothetical protein
MATERRPNPVLAAQLYRRGVSMSVIENAFVLAAVRRLMRPADAPRLTRFVRWLTSAGDRRNARLARQPGLLPVSRMLVGGYSVLCNCSASSDVIQLDLSGVHSES